MTIPIQPSLFPTRDSTQQVIQEGLADLPITSPNQLISLMRLYENTLLAELERKNNEA